MALAANVALAQEPVNFADPNLEAAVREELGIPVPTPIYPDDMLGLTDLGAYNAGIVSLVGLEHAANLTSLRLGANMISDLGPLSGLTSLEGLALYSNQISNLGPISNLTNLRGINLLDNTISDINDLAGLTNLERLALARNEISDINAVSGLTSLYQLDLRYNHISDISPLLSLTELIELRLENNPLDCLAYDIYIPQIIENNPGIVIDYDPRPEYCDDPVYFTDANLEAAVREELGMPELYPIYPNAMLLLTNLDASNSGILDLTGLEYATNLYRLVLNDNLVSDLEPISDLTQLSELELNHNQISDVFYLSQLTNLTKLELNNNSISNLEHLSALTNLVDLQLDFNLITDISDLSGLTNLEVLYLRGNQISTIDDLSGLTKVLSLDLRENLIEDINALSGLTELYQLGLSDNLISDISPLSGLMELHLLWLSNNQIEDITALSALTGLSRLYLAVNPLDCFAYDIYIPQIVENNPGIDITYDPRPVECPFQVNTETASHQMYPSVAMDADGDFVIAWQSDEQDGDNYGIYAQRYTNNGTPDGNEFRVNTYTANNQVSPCVAMGSDGNYVIAWRSRYGTYPDYAAHICARMFDSNGVPEGNEFQVNTGTNQESPAIAMDADGDFVIAWYDEDEIKAQIYNSDGTPAGGEFLVSTETAGWQTDPSVAMDADGDFIIVWCYHYEQGLFTTKYEIKAQIFDSNGAPIGGVLDIVSDSENTVNYPSVAMDADGDFVIAWYDDHEIKAQIYNSDGTPASAGNGFRVNTETLDWQRYPSVAMDSDGDFVVAWQSYGQDGSYYGIYAQWYSSDSTAIGGEYQVNTYIANDQEYPCVAMDADGNSVIAWQSEWQDGDEYGIYARMFSAGAGGRVEEVRLVIDYTSNVISGLIFEQPDVFMNDVVMYTLEATIEEVGELLVLRTAGGPYEEALKILEKKVLPKMDGCAVSGSPENGDWIITCEAQGQVYPSIVEAIGLLEELVGE